MSSCCPPHALVSDLNARTRPFDRLVKAQLRSSGGELVLGRAGVSTLVLCAGYSYDHEIRLPLVSLLPPVLLLRAERGGASGGSCTILCGSCLQNWVSSAQGRKRSSVA
ncbi:MAG: cupin domain-containing protein [Chloroflexi bacterium]|nr:cupin domain-containing protein [Chloroflexota bacterium]